MLTVPLFYALSLLGVIHYNMHVLLTSGNLLAYRLMFFIYLPQLSTATLLNNLLCRNHYVPGTYLKNITYFKNIKHCLTDFF